MIVGTRSRTSANPEWSRYYRIRVPGSVEALHARFIRHQYPRHRHEYFVVGLIESGVQSYWYRGARHTTPAGEIFLVNPDEPHTGESAIPDGYVYRTLYPQIQDMARIAGDIGVRANTPFFKGAVIRDPQLVRLLLKCHSSVSAKATRAECELRFLQAMARLLTAHADPQVIPVRRSQCERPAVRLAREYLEAHFANDVPLSELAELVGLSPYYFARTFEKETGLPPHLYLEGIRIKRARQFLDRGETLVSTAMLTGYSDQSHLTRRFKRFLGITPGQYARGAGESNRRAAPFDER
jgi:AraC-like DNA-binding protein